MRTVLPAFSLHFVLFCWARCPLICVQDSLVKVLLPSEVDCSWGALPNSQRKKRKLVVWASLLLYFIFRQKSLWFTRQALDQGHLLGFQDLHDCPDVSNSPTPLQPTLPPAPKCVSSPLSTHPPLLSTLPPCNTSASVLEDCLTTGCSSPTHPLSFVIIVHVYMWAARFAIQLWSHWYLADYVWHQTQHTEVIIGQLWLNLEWLVSGRNFSVIARVMHIPRVMSAVVENDLASHFHGVKNEHRLVPAINQPCFWHR